MSDVTASAPFPPAQPRKRLLWGWDVPSPAAVCLGPGQRFLNSSSKGPSFLMGTLMLVPPFYLEINLPAIRSDRDPVMNHGLAQVFRARLASTVAQGDHGRRDSFAPRLGDPTEMYSRPLIELTDRVTARLHDFVHQTDFRVGNCASGSSTNSRFRGASGS